MSALCSLICPQISHSLYQQKEAESKLYQELELQNWNADNEETKSNSDDDLTKGAQFYEYQSTFSFQNFEIIRQFSYSIFILTAIKFVLFPITIAYQTICFVFKIDSMLPNNVDYAKLSSILYYDYLHIIVGRVKLEQDMDPNKQWFIKQTKKQIKSRIVLSVIFIFMYIYGFIAAVGIGFGMIEIAIDGGESLAIIETLGPGQIFTAITIVYAYIISTSRLLMPGLPDATHLDDYMMNFKHDDSAHKINCHQFYEQFLSDLNAFGISVTTRRIIFCSTGAIVFASMPMGFRWIVGMTGWSSWWHIILFSWIIQVVLLSILGLCIVSKLFNGLTRTIHTNQILTYILKPKSSIFLNNTFMDKVCRCLQPQQRVTLPYLELGIDCNFIAWLELRSFIYWQNKRNIAESEAIIVYILHVRFI